MEKIVSGTYRKVIYGYDWGPALSKIIIKTDTLLDVGEINQGTFSLHVYKSQLDQDLPIKDAYVSTIDGEPSVNASSYITILPLIHPSVHIGNPFLYFNDLNHWADPYKVEVYLHKKTTHLQAIAFKEEPKLEIPEIEGFTFDRFSFSSDITLHYAFYTPKELKKKAPLIIWLHGAGEGGDDPIIALLGNRVVNLAQKEIQQYFDEGAYVLVPQVATMWMDDGSGNYTIDGTTKYQAALKALIDCVVTTNKGIDSNRIYIGGCSNGGFMTMKMIMEYPSYFAAAYPICEAYHNALISDEQIQILKNIPIWFVTAKTDCVVNPIEFIIPTYDRLMNAGARDVHLSLFDDVHDTSGLYHKDDGTPYEYFGHLSWIYLLNNEVKDNIQEKETSLFARDLKY